MSRIATLVQSANDIDTEAVEISQWGVTINVKSMTGRERSRYMSRFSSLREGVDEDDPDANAEAMGLLEAELIVACSYDPEDDSQVFGPEDIPMLFNKSGAAIGKLSAAAMRVSGLTESAEGKSPVGSETTLSVVSSSDSPSDST